MILKIGTRGSKLALAQSNWVKERIETAHSGVTVELVRIKTTGDKILDSPLSEIGGKGLFVKEIEEALLEQRVDVAVHSIKDVPAELPPSLMLSTFPEREDPRDALISVKGGGLERLSKGARIGTSSLRRASQLLHLRPDLNIVPLRGNVDTRLRKLQEGAFEAIVLAVAGLKRLGLGGHISEALSSEHVLPAIGQGALGLEVRCDDSTTLGLLRFLNHEPTETAVKAERAFLRELEGGCQVPIGGHCVVGEGAITLGGMVADLDGTTLIKREITGAAEDAEALGVALAKTVLDAGGAEILARVYREGV